jgi:arsenate reductase-like glutaredoxin family protein
MTLYGLPTCSTCSAALRAFAAADIPVTFRDVRSEPLSPDEWARLAVEVGQGVIDKASPAWRSLTAWIRESEVEVQLAHAPAMMARPVITDGTRWTVGWTPDIQALWGV